MIRIKMKIENNNEDEETDERKKLENSIPNRKVVNIMEENFIMEEKNQNNNSNAQVIDEEEDEAGIGQGRLIERAENIDQIKKEYKKKRDHKKKKYNQERKKREKKKSKMMTTSSAPTPLETKTKQKDCVMEVEFTMGNPNVEIITGKIQLFKNREDIATDVYEMDTYKPKERSLMVLVIAIPTIMSVTDFCLFVDTYMESIRTMTIMRDSAPNRYMGLLEFRDQASIDQFFEEYQNRPYTSFSSEDCKIVFVKSVELHYNASKIMKEHQFLPIEGIPCVKVHMEDISTENHDAYSHFKTVELPNCPVCFERLDTDIAGVLTTQCNHNFHTVCLSKWGDGTCPVCRYSGEERDAQCEVCGANENLWICITCGRVGCGRYVSKHAVEHFNETGHTFAMDLESQKVWDYAGDAYVHRLLGSGSKDVVASTSHDKQGVDEELMEATIQSKEDSIHHQYATLMAQQLNEQRVFWETRLKRLESEKEQEITQLKKNLKKQKAEASKFKSSHQKKIDHLESMNHCLTSNQEELKNHLQQKQQVIENYKAEVNDLLMHFETQNAIANSANAEAMSGGNIVISTKATTTTNKSKKKNGKRRKR